MKNKKQLILLFTILIISIFSTTSVLGVGCCVDITTTFTCTNEGAYNPIFGDINDETDCEEDFGGFWDELWCEEVTACETGCCCGGKDGSVGNVIESFCDDKEGSFTLGEENCNVACGVPTVQYTVQGTVEHPSGLAVNAIEVTILLSSGEDRLVVTDSLGQFTFSNIFEGDIFLTVNNGTCTARLPHYLYQDTTFSEITLSLDCDSSGTGPGACQPQWNCYMANPSITPCGERYENCEDTSGCTAELYTEYMDTLPPYNPCPVIPTTCNNDDEQQAGEICDGEDFGSVSEYCRDYLPGAIYDQRVVCTNCHIDTSTCDICPVDPFFCTKTQCNNCAEACAGNCPENNCLTAEPELTEQSIGFETEETSLTLSWNFLEECVNNVNNFNIKYCVDDPGCVDGFTNTIRIDRSTETKSFRFLSHRIEGIQPLRKYCFQMVANIQEDGMTNTTTSGKPICKEAGDTHCMQENPPQCNEDGTVMIFCGEENDMEPIECPTNQGCYPTLDGPTCADQTTCDHCNGLFSMYGYRSLSNLAITVPLFEGSLEPWDCDNSQVFISGGGNGVLTPPTLCYDEKTSTVADRLEACSEIQSCYDYKNSASCTNNHCQNIELMDGSGTSLCKWNEFDYVEEEASFSDETGLGVCVPKVIDNIPQTSACGRCNEDTHLLPGCTEELCHLYEIIDKDCFYTTVDSFYGGECISKDEASCVHFSTENDCTGNDELKVDAQYTNANRVSGTNKILSTSSDYFNFGVCEWTGSKCIKNADNYTHSPSNPSSDCTHLKTEDPEKYKLCLKDFTQPITELFLIDPDEQTDFDDTYPVYSANNLFTYSVIDELYDESFFTVNVTDASEYPDLKYSSLIGIISDPEINGPYNVSYYSIDLSKNLENVTNSIIILDNLAPTFGTYEEITSSYELVQDFYVTNVTMNFNFSDIHGPLTCTAELTSPITGEEFGGDRTYYSVPSGETITAEYINLADGIYYFNMTCIDHLFLNNMGTKIEELSLDADKSITNPQPYRKTYSITDQINNVNVVDSIIISIEAEEAINCYYLDAETGSNPIDNTAYQTLNHIEGTNTFTATINYPERGIVHHYFTGCTFPEGKQTQGKDTDSIIFSIDNDAPETTVMLSIGLEKSPYIETVDEVTDEAVLSFSVTDENNSLIKRTENGIYFDGTAGVVETRWMKDNNPTDSTNPDDYQAWNGEPILITAANVGEGRFLHYYSIDAKGNTEDYQTQQIYVRDLNIMFDTVIIYTSSGGIYTS